MSPARVFRFAVLVTCASVCALLSSGALAAGQTVDKSSVYTCEEGDFLDGSVCIKGGTRVWIAGDYRWAEPSCPPGWEAVDGKCTTAATMLNFACPEGGAPASPNLGADGRIDRCVADLVDGTQCPTDYLPTDGRCEATPVATVSKPRCQQGELAGEQCELPLIPNATCDGTPTHQHPDKCGHWQVSGGTKYPATVITQPTPLPAPEQVGSSQPTATATPPVVELDPAPTAPLGNGIITPAGLDIPEPEGEQANQSTTTAPPATASPTQSMTPTPVPSPQAEATPATEVRAAEGSKSLAFTGTAAKPLVLTAMGLMLLGFVTVEATRKLRQHEVAKYRPRMKR